MKPNQEQITAILNKALEKRKLTNPTFSMRLSAQVGWDAAEAMYAGLTSDLTAAYMTGVYEARRSQIATLQQAYEAGWRRCAEWAKRDDLPADGGSGAYFKDRDQDLHAIKTQLRNANGNA